jgi:glutamyl/glutaminyl-tRNA synthetase
MRTRFAPSPTGSLHVGGARTALYCRLLARRHDGRFLLRIEDTDQARSTDEAAAGILRDLAWLGLTWDEGPGAEEAGTGPYFQSQRLARYEAVLQQLLDAGHAYEAWDTVEELAAARAAAEADKRNFRYRGGPVSEAQRAAFLAEGRQPVVRLRAPEAVMAFEDGVLGPSATPPEDLDDLVIRKADGFPTYHFAVVVDDHDMGVTHVLRGQEHFMNTPKHLALYQALGWEPPEHAHLPIIFNPEGGKMSKRDKAKVARAAARDAVKATSVAEVAARAGLAEQVLADFLAKKSDAVPVAEALASALGVALPLIEVMDFRKQGFLPEALLNYLALLGWSPGGDREELDEGELIAAFDLAGVNKTAARFDPDKLAWMNGVYLRKLPLERLLEAHDAYLAVRPDSPFAAVDASFRGPLLELYRPRLSTLAELDTMARFFLEAPATYDDKAMAKWVRKDPGPAALAAAAELLATTPWTAEALEAAFAARCEAEGWGLGKLAQPVRVALTGTAVSPGIQETLVLFDREEALRRVARLRALVG